jgi:hypothetical protein
VDTSVCIDAPDFCGGPYSGFESDPIFSDAIDKASTISHTPTVWIPPSTTMKLLAERWKSFGERPAGAMAPVDWVWLNGMPARTSHPNHKSAQDCAAQLGEQLDSCETMGMIEYCPEDMDPAQFVHNVLPLGARVKSNGSVRMLVDPSLPGVNQAMADLPCDLPCVEDIFKTVEKGDCLGKRDLENSFFHCVLSETARRHMGFRHPVTGRLARWVVLPQGTKQSPAIFCAVSTAAARIFNRLFETHGIRARCIVYVDDFICVAKSHGDMRAAFDVMDSEAEQLGLVFNPSKDLGKDQPLHEIEALGLLLNSDTLTLSLPESKRISYRSEVSDFVAAYRSSPTCPRKPLEKLVGKLVYACRVCTWGYLFIQEILDQLYPVGMYPPPRTVTLTEGVWHDLRFWDSALGDAFPTWMGVMQHMVGKKEVHVDPTNFSTTLYTDASGGWGVGGIFGHEVMSQRWQRDVSGEHIGALELEALYEALHHWRHDLAHQTVLARMDNVQAVSAINKGASRKPALRATLLKIALMGLEFKFQVRARHVKGVDNPADAPSRGKQPARTQDYTFSEFHRFNTHKAQVDCCAAASGYNVQPGCTEFYSTAKPVQDHVPDLVGKVLWANVPFISAGLVLDAIVAAWRVDPVNTMATCVVPDWPTASWYRKYLRRRKPLFRVVHRYPAGCRVFFYRDTQKLAPSSKFDILVIRIGGSQA